MNWKICSLLDSWKKTMLAWEFGYHPSVTVQSSNVQSFNFCATDVLTAFFGENV